jgi:uncharacterized protein
MERASESKEAAVVGGRFLNTGDGNCLQIIDLQHPVYVAAVEPDTAFWSLIEKGHLAHALGSGEIAGKLKRHFKTMSEEMETLRFGLTPSAVYFNPTEQCNLNCTYCYIPQEHRKNGRHMTWAEMEKALLILRDYFSATMPSGGRKPQIVFHGSEPLMNKRVVFRAVDEYVGEFDFGIQTNATLLEKEDVQFLVSRSVALGVSLDGHTPLVADKHRKNWAGDGTFRKVLKAVEMCRDYPLFNVICTVTSQNVRSLVKIVEFFHEWGVENCLMNQVRCTLEGGRAAKPSDPEMARMFIKALDRTFELYRETGRKLIIGNFANILLGIIAPTGRRLMCDISPCGGGRCFFAVSAEGDVYPCSEFIGLPGFKGGNLFEDELPAILASDPFKMVTGRKVENITPCSRCAIRHFCGAPCPAEAYQAHGSMEGRGAFCEFYEHQVRYAMRLIADKVESAYLWDNWDRDTKEMFRL